MNKSFNLQDQEFAFEMFCLRKKIEAVNVSSEDYSDEYIDQLSIQKTKLLNQHLQKEYGNNVISLSTHQS